MKKYVKIAVFTVIGLISGTVAAAQMTSQSETRFVDEMCAIAPLVCKFTTSSNGDGVEPPEPKDPPTETK